jgi:hypothetical protein
MRLGDPGMSSRSIAADNVSFICNLHLIYSKKALQIRNANSPAAGRSMMDAKHSRRG